LIGFLINEAVKRRAIRYSPVGGCWNGAFSFQKLRAEGRGEEQKHREKRQSTYQNKVNLFFPGSQVRQKCTRILLQLEVV
jgi:hypothetical protein